MQSQVTKLVEYGVIDTSLIALDSTPILANTSLNNPKSYHKNIIAQITRFIILLYKFKKT